MSPQPGRFAFIDIARGVAIIAMVIYHLAFDLSAQRLIGVDVIGSFGWTVFARLIAGTFIFLVGFNLVLAARNGLNPRRFLRRLALIVGGAALVSLATWLFDPRTFVFFGILHQIALSSVLGLLFLRVPTVALIPVSAAIIALPVYFDHALFDHPALWWVGLSATDPVSIDYVPLFPWFGVALAGMVAGRLFVEQGLESPLATWAPSGRLAGSLRWAGRWSLVIYLIHQPILVGLVSLAAQFVPPNVDLARSQFNAQCVPACTEAGRGGDICTAYCTCMFEGLYDTDLYSLSSVEEMTADQNDRWNEVIVNCTAGVPAPLE